MKIENLDCVRELGNFRDTLLRIKRRLSKDNIERRIRVYFCATLDDLWDDVSSDNRLLELFEQAIDTRLKEVEEQILSID